MIHQSQPFPQPWRDDPWAPPRSKPVTSPWFVDQSAPPWLLTPLAPPRTIFHTAPLVLPASLCHHHGLLGLQLRLIPPPLWLAVRLLLSLGSASVLTRTVVTSPSAPRLHLFCLSWRVHLIPPLALPGTIFLMAPPDSLDHLGQLLPCWAFWAFGCTSSLHPYGFVGFLLPFGSASVLT